MRSERLTWAEIKRARIDHPEARAGYDRARRAYELGEQIRTLRCARGMTQSALATRAGTTQAAIARIAAGGVLPTIDSLERVGTALGVALTVRFEETHVAQ